MNTRILHKEVQDFIDRNLDTDITSLLFKGSPFDDISIQELASQLSVKKRCEKKLPTWYQSKNIYYPHKLNFEQASSELTAQYKLGLIHGNTIVDLTGGFGVDSYYFTKRFKKVSYCEQDETLSAIAAHNFKQLGVDIEVFAIDGLTYLKESNKQFDWIYLDPSRRDAAKRKVFLLEDCQPNIPENLDLLFRYSLNLLIKVSPLLDIKQVITELGSTKEVHIVAVANEVKELLFVLEKGYTDSISIKAINITKNGSSSFEAGFQSKSEAIYSEPLSYLYEPNAAILKAGLFNEVSSQLNVSKLHKNSHLYTSKQLIKFPGRHFKIQHKIKFNKKQLHQLIPSKKANITVRNFPEKVADIRKKLQFKDGGDDFLFFTTDLTDDHIVLICEKV